MDDWKLIVKKGKPFLYNLKTDIHEDNDVALQHPDIVEKLKKDAILDGFIPNEYEAAHAFMLERAAKMGLKPLD